MVYSWGSHNPPPKLQQSYHYPPTTHTHTHTPFKILYSPLYSTRFMYGCGLCPLIHREKYQRKACLSLCSLSLRTLRRVHARRKLVCMCLCIVYLVHAASIYRRSEPAMTIPDIRNWSLTIVQCITVLFLSRLIILRDIRITT